MTSSVHGLIADIGGTNSRFALISEQGDILSPATLPCADYSGPVDAVRSYMRRHDTISPAHAVFAIAGPVGRDDVAATNMAWRFSVEKTKEALGLQSFSVVNDLTAVALALPYLDVCDYRQIGGGRITPDAPVAVLGAGTGLGVSGLVHSPRGEWIPLTGEGGHTTLCVTNERQDRVVELMRRRFGHVSAERILSGPGLCNLYAALHALDGRDGADLSADQITRNAVAGTCAVCEETLHIFFSLLGTTAGNLALTLGAFGGVFISGGIVPRLLDACENSAFRKEFEGKGRMKLYLEKIPTFVVTHHYPAFLGLSRLVRKQWNKSLPS